MVTIDQAMRGVAQYADNEIIPHLPTGKGIGVGIALALIMDGGKAQLLKLRENPAVQMMGVMDEAGNIDLERLYNAARPRFDGQKLPVTVPRQVSGFCRSCASTISAAQQLRAS